MVHEQFYKELGKLLYALAFSDGVIQKQEIKTLNHIVKNELRKNMQHRYTTQDELLLSKLSFQNCVTEKVAVQEALHSFLKFYELNGALVQDQERLLALKLIKKISSAYHGVSEKESIILKAVKAILEKNYKNAE